MSIKTELKLAYLKDTKNLIKNAIIEKGQDVSDSDTFRSYAEKILAISGGGSGGGIDTSKLEVIFPITELTASADMDGMAPVMNPFGLSVGDICLVDWNGVGYISEAKTIDLDGILLVGIGNTAVLGGEDTGEPFAVGELPEEMASQTGGMRGLVAPLDGSTTFKIGIYRIKSVLEDIPIALDFSNGDQTIAAPDGQLVKSAVIEKPANLVPENIMSGVDIAGIIGTAVAGGGSGSGSKKIKVVNTTLSSLSNATRVSKQICTASENDPFFVMVWRANPKPFSATNSNDRTFIYAYAFDTSKITLSEGEYGNNIYSRYCAYREGSYGIAFNSSTQTGLCDPIDTTGMTGDNLVIHQGDIYFYRNSYGEGYIDVGLPFSSKDGVTYKWASSDAHNLLALIMED